MSESNKQWYSLSVDEIYKKLHTSYKGLSRREAEKRLVRYGPNTLPEEKPLTLFDIIIEQIKSPLIYILIIAAVVSLVFDIINQGDFTDFIVIAVVVVLNIIIGSVQGIRAQKTLESLKKTVVSYTTVEREGTIEQIETKNLVKGDIVILDVGDKVPADCRIIEQQDLLVDESALTGESVAVQKISDTLDNKKIIVPQQKNMLFMGTVIVQGKARAVVVETGINTELGRIAQMLAEDRQTQTPLQKKISAFSKKISIMVLITAFFIFILGFFRGPFDWKNIVLMFETAIAISVSAIPEGLAVAVTVILVVGMQRILKKKALVKRLLAAEVLGSTTIICTDKTGTLTKGQMQIEYIDGIDSRYSLDDLKSGKSSFKKSPFLKHLIMNSILCSDAVIFKEKGKVEFEGTPTEKALLHMAYNAGFDIDRLRDKHKRLDVISFNSRNKYMVVLSGNGDKNIIYIKGALEKVLSFCDRVLRDNGRKETLRDEDKEKIIEKASSYSREGKRILSFAFRETKDSVLDKNSDPAGFVFLGFVVIYDPLRKSVEKVIEICREAGVKVAIVTGDYPVTAQAVAKQIGIPSSSKHILTGDRLSGMSDEELDRVVDKIHIYARVVPEDKLRIVKSLQRKGEVVAMTGDGVNDAPALKQADIGVALGSGTEVAKDASDMILLDNNFNTIVAAVREGRVIYDNIKKVVLYFVSDSFAGVTLLIIALLSGLPLPILVAQILYINLLNDSMPALSLTQDPPLEGIMKQSPQERDKPVLDKMQQIFIAAISVTSGIIGILIFVYMWRGGLDLDYARTMVFSFLSLKSLVYIFSIRDLRKPLWRIKIFSNKYVNIAFAAGIVLQIAAIYAPFMQKFLNTVPLMVWDWLVIIVFCAVILFIVEFVKAYFSRQYAYQKS